MAVANSLARLSESDFVRTAQRIGIVPTNKEAKCGEIWLKGVYIDGGAESFISSAFASPTTPTISRGSSAKIRTQVLRDNDPLPDRIFVPEILTGHRLVDDNHPRRVFGV